RHSYCSAVSAGADAPAAGHLAAALRRCSDQRRRFFSECASADGSRFHAIGSGRPFRARQLSVDVIGRRFWRTSYCFWILDRKETLWLGNHFVKEQRKEPTNARAQGRSAQRGKSRNSIHWYTNACVWALSAHSPAMSH